MARVQGKSWEFLPAYGDDPDVGCSHTVSSSEATASSAAVAAMSRFCGSIRSAQSAPTTCLTSSLLRCLRTTRRFTSSVIRSPPGVTAVGSSRRTSSAKDSGLPLCGVADARMRASVFGESTRASRLFCVAELVTLWDSSITTASHR